MESFCDNGMYIRKKIRNGNNQTLLLIHGLGESSLGFERILKEESLSKYNIISPDLIGYGRSIQPSNPRSIVDHAEDLIHLLNFLKIEKVILIGHSMGGVIAIEMIEKHKARISGLINIEGNISIQDCTGSLEASSMSVDLFLKEGFKKMTNHVLEKGIKDLAFRSYYPSICLSHFPTFYLNSLELVENSKKENLSKRLGIFKNEIPRIYIYGSPRGTGEYSRNLLKNENIKIEKVENAGHWPHIDQPKEFFKIILNFLNENKF